MIKQQLTSLMKQPTQLCFLKVSMILVIVFSVVFMFSGCEQWATVTIENSFAFDLTITHRAEYNNGAESVVTNMGTAPAGQTTKLKAEIMLSSDVAGDKVVLRGKDPSGLVVWKQSWEFEDFLKLKDTGWKIVVGPDEAPPQD